MTTAIQSVDVLYNTAQVFMPWGLRKEKYNQKLNRMERYMKYQGSALSSTGKGHLC